MATGSGLTHVERTQGSTRNEVAMSLGPACWKYNFFSLQEFSLVKVVDVRQLSPTVKGFTLHVDNQRLSFKPGQW